MTEKYKGFGEELTLKEWADRLNMRVSLLRGMLEMGKSVEELAEFFKINYTGQRQRKPREGARMTETRQLVENLLRRSGYEVGPESVTVKPIYKTFHAVEYEGQRVGTFDYSTGVLSKLYNSGVIPLTAEYSQQLTIQRDERGRWGLTSETTGIVAAKLLGRRETPTEADYNTAVATRKAADGNPASRELYEYRGQKCTSAEWARRLGLSGSTVWRYLKQGATVEEIIKRLGVNYPE